MVHYHQLVVVELVQVVLDDMDEVVEVEVEMVELYLYMQKL